MANCLRQTCSALFSLALLGQGLLSLSVLALGLLVQSLLTENAQAQTTPPHAQPQPGQQPGVYQQQPGQQSGQYQQQPAGQYQHQPQGQYQPQEQYQPGAGVPQQSPPQYGQQPQQGVQPPQGQLVVDPQQQQQQLAPPREPFTLNAAEQQLLDTVLTAWEQRSAEVNTLESSFRMFEYDQQFGPPPAANGQMQAKRISDGEVRFAKPDKGYYKINTISQFTLTPQPNGQPPKAEYKPIEEPGEHWVCDGKSVYEVNHTKRQLIERPMPPEMQGKAISDGPMPFVFGAEATKLKERYWLRITTPANAPGQIWLEAYPKRMDDAANYFKVDLILSGADMLPYAVKLYEPNHNSKVYVLSDTKKNAALNQIGAFLGWFVSPKAPWGYQTIVDRSMIADRQPSQPGQPIR